MDLATSFGLDPKGGNLTHDRARLGRVIAAKLAALGVLPQARLEEMGDVGGLLAAWNASGRLGITQHCPADARVQAFLDRSLAKCGAPVPRLPAASFILDRHGLARELSLPEDGDRHETPLLSSYRLGNGVMHNPASDRRTTQGSFHVAEGGLPIAPDKYAVPAGVFARMLAAAVRPTPELLRVPWTANWAKPAECFVSLLLRPLVVPAVPGQLPEQRMEVRFLVPGSLVANLDFVESIFGNAGDAFLPDNDAGLDPDWTGTTGMVILAPHLTHLTKKELGLPHVDQATPRQKAEGMCWKDPGERYNGGNAFKLTHRDASGVVVTLIADNYFGYCKKEVKTQISFSANLIGMAEEEHAGGALAFPTYHLGDHFIAAGQIASYGHTFADTLKTLGDEVEVMPEGYAVLKADERVVFVPETAEFSLKARSVTWQQGGKQRRLTLFKERVYVHPSGYKVRLARHPGAPSWRLLGTWAYGTFCHKPCTVSGGGKSEISKSLADAVIHGPMVVYDIDKDLALVQQIVTGSYENRLKPQFRPDYTKHKSRGVLSPERSLGSVIKMFTPADDFTDEYNAWLRSIPPHIWPLVYIVKRFHRPEWGDDWRSHFTVDRINGRPGYQLKFEGRPLVGEYLRVGFEGDGGWRTFKLRQDFIPADKVQMEDDITASVVVPGIWLGLDPAKSYKLSQNCESRLFQRPDDAIHRGYDKQTEIDMSSASIFCSNFQPLTNAEVQAEVDDAPNLDQYTPPMRQHLERAIAAGTPWTVSSARPRMIDGKPSKNPRYLQVRPDLADPLPRRVAEICLRLFHRTPRERGLSVPVDAVLAGRRNNPPEKGVRPLCVYNPIHYQELPELFMDYVSSLTGKSPSTTGAGSEGALTKGPFNALRATADLNAALVSMILTGHDGFSTAAGWVGPKWRMDHDVSLLVPELWCRLKPEERTAEVLIKRGHLERVEDMVHDGRAVKSSRLGWRITSKFLHDFFGRIFDNGTAVFDAALLRPETQDMAVFADGVDNIVSAHQRVAQDYLVDGAIEDACPPLQALLTIMATGSWNGKDEKDATFRAMFTREALLRSDWYKLRIYHQQRLDIAGWRDRVTYLQNFMERPENRTHSERLGLAKRLDHAQRMLDKVSAPAWRDRLVGTIGADPTLGA
jgi:hypothetical protein